MKGYWLYDPNRAGKVIYSRDVKFNETEFGFEKEPNAVEPIRYVELEVSSSTEEPEEDTAVSREEAVSDRSVEEPATRRSSRIWQKPDYYVERVSITKHGLEEPTTVKEALASQQKANSGFHAGERSGL